MGNSTATTGIIRLRAGYSGQAWESALTGEAAEWAEAATGEWTLAWG
jgi:hypothetical protein